MLTFSARDFISKRKLLFVPVLTLAISASAGWAQVPSIVIDAQQTIGTGYNQPQSIAVSQNGTIFIADTNNNRVLALNPMTGVSTPVSTGGTITLSTPIPLALDANGDLFVGDTPSGVGGRIVELTGDGTGNLTGAAKVYFAGSPLTNPIALAVDSSGTLFIGDYPNTGNGVIYSLPSSGTTPTALSFPGIPTQFTPASLFRAGNNLYIADNGDLANGIGGVYVAPAAGGNAQRITTGAFTIAFPTGIRLDAAGNIYIASFLGTGTGYNAGQQVVVVPAASPSTPYILPNTGLGAASDVAFDPAGNLDVLDYVNGHVVQLTSANPVNLGKQNNVGATGSPVQFNFEFNAPTTLRGFRIVTQGDVSTDLIQNGGGSCVNGKHTNLGTGGPSISAYYPYTCMETFSGTPAYPGIRASAIQVKGPNTTILASTPVYQTGFAGAEIVYPLNEATTVTGLQAPYAVAISGLNKTVYVADGGSGQVYSIKGLGGSALTPVSTGTITLSAPTALALDGAGDLFIADFNNAQIVEVPPADTGVAPSVVNTGGLLQHPIALAFDFLGNLYIGDAGPGGLNASSGNPGFVVKIPVGGAAFKVNVPGIPIVFPQALATDPYTAALLIGDGGDLSGVGKVVQLYADGTAGTGPINGVTNPGGLAFDPADDLYILDGTANTITVVEGPNYPNQVHTVQFDNSTLVAASGLAISAGGQSFVIANLAGPGNSSLVRLNGNASTLAFGGVKVGSQSQTQTATVYNIGNLNMTLGSPWYTTNGANAAFNILGSSYCDNGNFLAPSWSCNIDVQFSPQFVGQTTQQLTVLGDGYNGGSGAISPPVLTLRGTGKN
jgi:sugar lactone lactonase YvrE